MPEQNCHHKIFKLYIVVRVFAVFVFVAVGSSLLIQRQELIEQKAQLEVQKAQYRRLVTTFGRHRDD